MTRRLVAPMLLVAALAAITGTPHAQTTAPATYDVSTVKPSTKADDSMGLNWRHGQLKADNATLTWLLTAAFDIRRDQLSGAPDWAREKHYDINAKLLDADPATEDKLSDDQHRALLVALLVERFGLKYHVETREMATYDLLPTKGGLKLTPAVDPDDKSKKVFGMCTGCFRWSGNEISGHGMPTDALARILAMSLERTVNDRTGYTGKIDVDLKWAPDLSTGPASDADVGLRPLPKALEEQLGLHLQPSRGPVKLYVVDHLDKPSEN